MAAVAPNSRDDRVELAKAAMKECNLSFGSEGEGSDVVAQALRILKKNEFSVTGEARATIQRNIIRLGGLNLPDQTQGHSAVKVSKAVTAVIPGKAGSAPKKTEQKTTLDPHNQADNELLADILKKCMDYGGETSNFTEMVQLINNKQPVPIELASKVIKDTNEAINKMNDMLNRPI